MTAQTFLIPLPPSVNAMFRNVPGVGRVKTTDYKRWREVAGWQLKAQKPVKLTGDVAVKIEVRRPRSTADLDNRAKAVGDLLKGVVIEDDRQIVDLRMLWADVEACRVTVMEAGDAS